MEFYEFFEKIVSYIPEGYESIKHVCEAILPWLFGLLTLATCFVGHFMEKVWNFFFFFTLGFIIPLFILYWIFTPSGFLFWLMVVLCVALGGLCAYYSHHLHKIKLFVTTFFLVYIAVSSYLIGLGKLTAVLLGFIVGILAGILNIRYKYIAVMATTAFSGSMMFWDMIESRYTINHILVQVLVIVLGVLGLTFQTFIEKEELKKSYDHVKGSYQKVQEKSKLTTSKQKTLKK